MDIENAQLARRNGKYKKALELYKLAVIENPNNAEALAGLALTHVYLKEKDIAFARATEAIQLDPNQSLAHIALGSVYFSKEQIEQYKEEVEKAFALQPFFYEVGCTYAKMLLNDKKIDEAIPIFEKVIEANPKKVCPHYLLGWAYTSKKLYNDAYREYRKAFLVQPSFETARAVLSGLINKFRPWSILILIGVIAIWSVSALVTKIGALTFGIFFSSTILLDGINRYKEGKRGWAMLYFITFIILIFIFYYLYKNATV
jgi:tetratricopeptide (TPR) repeat protein